MNQATAVSSFGSKTFWKDLEQMSASIKLDAFCCRDENVWVNQILACTSDTFWRVSISRIERFPRCPGFHLLKRWPKKHSLIIAPMLKDLRFLSHGSATMTRIHVLLVLFAADYCKNNWSLPTSFTYSDMLIGGRIEGQLQILSMASAERGAQCKIQKPHYLQNHSVTNILSKETFSGKIKLELLLSS